MSSEFSQSGIETDIEETPLVAPNTNLDFVDDGVELDNDPPSPDPTAFGTGDKDEDDEGEVRNVILSGDRLEDALPEGLTNIGMVAVELPDAEGQAAGFYLPQEQAAVLIAQFRQFKFFVKKGQATPPVRIGE